MAGCQKKAFTHQSWPPTAEHSRTQKNTNVQMCKNVQKNKWWTQNANYNKTMSNYLYVKCCINASYIILSTIKHNKYKQYYCSSHGRRSGFIIPEKFWILVCHLLHSSSFCRWATIHHSANWNPNGGRGWTWFTRWTTWFAVTQWTLADPDSPVGRQPSPPFPSRTLLFPFLSPPLPLPLRSRPLKYS